MAFKKGGVVAVDFDGVINSYQTRGPELVDPPEPGALDFINRLIGLGLVPVVFTTRARTAKGARKVERWLAENDFPAMMVTADKFAALAYIDDRAVPYVPRSGDWDTVLSALEAMTTLNARREIPDVFDGTTALVDTNA